MSVNPQVGGPFDLVDHHGCEVSNRTFMGSVVLMLFGFTHCRVVCPRSLRKLSAVLDEMGAAADELVALYVTVDPERDDPATMRSCLREHPRFTGLTGSRQQIDRIKAAYRVYARRRFDQDTDADYEIAHTTLAYVLDREGVCVSHFPLVLDNAELVERLRECMK